MGRARLDVSQWFKPSFSPLIQESSSVLKKKPGLKNKDQLASCGLITFNIARDLFEKRWQPQWSCCKIEIIVVHVQNMHILLQMMVLFSICSQVPFWFLDLLSECDDPQDSGEVHTHSSVCTKNNTELLTAANIIMSLQNLSFELLNFSQNIVYQWVVCLCWVSCVP